MHALRFLFIIFVAAFGSMALLSMLPHDPYMRFQRLDIGAHAKAKWIYERTVLDPTPIDIAFVGTSHTMNGVDAEYMQSIVATGGEETPHIVNLAIPNFGRDMHYVISKFLLTNKQVKHLFIEVREIESRDMHPAFHYLADTSDLIDAPLIVNTRYAENLARLPQRQLALFFDTQFPEFFNSKTHQASEQIPEHLDRSLYNPDGSFRARVTPLEELQKAERNWNRVQAPKMNRDNKFINYLNFNASFTYIEKIAQLAKQHKVELHFVYIPEYGAQDLPVDMAFYEKLSNVWTFNQDEIFSNTNHWSDHSHLNGNGARALTNALANRISQELLVTQ